MTYFATVHSSFIVCILSLNGPEFGIAGRNRTIQLGYYPRIVVVYSNVPNIRRIPIDFVGVSVMIGII